MILNKIYKEIEGKLIKGASIPVFIHNDAYFSSEVKVFEDGTIDCWSLVDFEGFKKKVESGWVVTRLPEGARVSYTHLGSFTATNVNSRCNESELVKEVEDILSELQGTPTSSEKCQAAYSKYLENPSEENKKKLKEAYYRVPEHHRVYLLGSMDDKDFPIRRVIGA